MLCGPCCCCVDDIACGETGRRHLTHIWASCWDGGIGFKSRAAWCSLQSDQFVETKRFREIPLDAAKEPSNPTRDRPCIIVANPGRLRHNPNQKVHPKPPPRPTTVCRWHSAPLFRQRVQGRAPREAGRCLQLREGRRLRLWPPNPVWWRKDYRFRSHLRLSRGSAQVWARLPTGPIRPCHQGREGFSTAAKAAKEQRQEGPRNRCQARRQEEEEGRVSRLVCTPTKKCYYMHSMSRYEWDTRAYCSSSISFGTTCRIRRETRA